MAPIFVDTVYDVAGGEIDWEVICNRLNDEDPKITITKATVDWKKPLGPQCGDAPCSFLHRIGARTNKYSLHRHDQMGGQKPYH